MTTLYKRATPSQNRILRIVEGAVRNTVHGHPSYNIPESFARSVAKRAAGTLSAQWLEVLTTTSSGRVGESVSNPRPQRGLLMKPTGRGPSQGSRRPPLSILWKQLSMQIWHLRKSGQNDKANTYVEVLRMIALLQRDS